MGRRTTSGVLAMSDPTTTGCGSGGQPPSRDQLEGAGEIGGEAGTHAKAATNGPDLALRSPAPTPAPDHDEQLVVVRRAIYDTRTQAGHWRQVTGVDNAPAIAQQRDRDADVLEHVLRRLIAPVFSEDVGLFVHQVGGVKEKQYFRLEATDGRLTLRALDIEGQPLVCDVDTAAAAERLLRRGVR